MVDVCLLHKQLRLWNNIFNKSVLLAGFEVVALSSNYTLKIKFYGPVLVKLQ